MKFNRYLKKIIKDPSRAWCRKCGGKLALSQDKSQFKCIVCNRTIYVGKKGKENNYIQREEEPKIFEMIQHRIDNEFYKLKDGTEYNPVIRKVMNGDEPTLVSDEEHDKYYKEIRNTLCEMILR